VGRVAERSEDEIPEGQIAVVVRVHTAVDQTVLAEPLVPEQRGRGA
jgi:hypothetical protein